MTREVIKIVALDQPICSRQYGDAFLSPTGGCRAILGTTGTRKCYNSAFTCQDPANYSPTTLTLYFSEPGPDLARYYGYVIPSISELRTTPSRVNIGGLDTGQSSLGLREAVSVTFTDHRHSDLLVDKYRLERASGAAASDGDAFEPYTRGTFWGKWKARNPYSARYPLRVYQGELGEPLASMRCRHYVVERVDGPNRGTVQVMGKDALSLIETSKAVAPAASRGRLVANLAATATGSPTPTFQVEPTGIGNEDYPSGSFLVAIGKETMRVTRSGDVFTVTERGVNGVVEDHDQEDGVQLVATFSTMLAHDIIYDLISNYTALGTEGSPTGSPYINKAEWNSAASSVDELYTATIAEPVPVAELVGELLEVAGLTLWVNVETGMLDLRALRAGSSVVVFGDEGHALADSPVSKDLPERRVSQVWIYYGEKDPLGNREPTNFHSRYVDIDSDAESTTQYGVPKIREIFSRWIPQFGRTIAAPAAARILAMLRDPPIEATFTVQADALADDNVGIADYVDLELSDGQNVTGDVDTVQHVVTRIDRGDFTAGVTTQSVVFYDQAEDGGVRIIYIENDDQNLNLRSVHDMLYSAPVGGSPTQRIRFIVEDEVHIGSASSSLSALRTGSWPAGVVLELVNNGRIAGAGGTAGAGGNAPSSGVPISDGSAGSRGGTAILAEYAITITNNGQIYGGGGGGGGGGAAAINAYEDPTSYFSAASGAGGGGGQADETGLAAPGGASTDVVSPAGTNGNEDAAGEGGTGADGSQTSGHGTVTGGNGGDGGDFGQAGDAGTAGVATPGLGFSYSEVSNGGSGGPAGYYIEGIAFVTLASPTGDVRGATS